MRLSPTATKSNTLRVGSTGVGSTSAGFWGGVATGSLGVHPCANKNNNRKSPMNHTVLLGSFFMVVIPCFSNSLPFR